MTSSSPQRKDRLQWAIADSAAPIAASTEATASCRLLLTRPASASTEGVTAELFNVGDPVARRSWAQESGINAHLTQSLSLADRRAFVRERIPAASVPPLAIRAEMQRRCLPAEAGSCEFMYYRDYAGTLELSINRGRSPAGPPRPLTAACAALRTRLFWCSDADGLPDELGMQIKSGQLIAHCLAGLQAHHRASVLLGDIQPSRLFYLDQQESSPAFGGFAHATAMDRPDNGTSTITGRSGSRSVADDRRQTPVAAVWRNDSSERAATATTLSESEQSQVQTLTREPPDPQLLDIVPTPSTFGALHDELNTCLGRDVLAGLVRAGVSFSGSTQRIMYRSPESTPSELLPLCRQFHSEWSDHYSLFAALLEILIGHDREIDAESGWRGRQLAMISEDTIDVVTDTYDFSALPSSLEDWLQRGARATVAAPVAQWFRTGMQQLCTAWGIDGAIDGIRDWQQVARQQRTVEQNIKRRRIHLAHARAAALPSEIGSDIIIPETDDDDDRSDDAAAAASSCAIDEADDDVDDDPQSDSESEQEFEASHRASVAAAAAAASRGRRGKPTRKKRKKRRILPPPPPPPASEQCHPIYNSDLRARMQAAREAIAALAQPLPFELLSRSADRVVIRADPPSDQSAPTTIEFFNDSSAADHQRCIFARLAQFNSALAVPPAGDAIRQQIRWSDRLCKQLAGCLQHLDQCQQQLQEMPADDDAAESLPPRYLTHHALFFKLYTGTLADAIGDPDSPLSSGTLTLRRALFWHSDRTVMQIKALRLVRHCFVGLQAHHRRDVLIGDICPSKMLYEMQPAAADGGACMPIVFGDYRHATCMTDGRSGKHVHIHCIAQQRYGNWNRAYVFSAMQARPYGRALTLDLSFLDPEAEAVESQLPTLAGLLAGEIGTWPYQAPETFTSHSLSGCVGNANYGQFEQRSDAYALALTLLEVLVGRPCSVDRTAMVYKPDAAEALPAAVSSSHVAALIARNADPSVAASAWDARACALLPINVAQDLHAFLHCDVSERPSVDSLVRTCDRELAARAIAQGEST